MYPVTAWELERDRRIAIHQGWNNPFVIERANAGGVMTGAALQQPTQTNAQPLQSAQAATTPPIRGNRRSNVYHLPEGCPSYNAMSPANVVEFESEQAAINSGFRKAGNCR